MITPTDWKKYHAQKVAELSQETVTKIVAFLAANLGDQDLIRDAERRDPQEWWVPYHLHWGMGIRNILRTHGFGEKDLGVDNLDDYYIGLVELAVCRDE